MRVDVLELVLDIVGTMSPCISIRRESEYTDVESKNITSNLDIHAILNIKKLNLRTLLKEEFLTSGKFGTSRLFIE